MTRKPDMAKPKAWIFSFFLGVFLFGSHAAAEEIRWQDWQPGLFQQAQNEQKFVLLDLQAVWCHWCHVMEETTYRDPNVQLLMNQKYIAVRVDQESRPDLALRYEDWGWPATVIFAPDGSEIVKRRGYIEPAAMASLLQAVIEDPTPGPSVEKEEPLKFSQASFLSEAQKKMLEEEHFGIYDYENGGWGTVNKLIDSDNLEFAVTRAMRGNKDQEKMAQQTLDAALNLLDREWGGFYQYSDTLDWKSPHYEKIMPVQAQYLRLYAQASALWNKKEYAEAADKIFAYVSEFWTSPGGAFYTSQDADVDERMKGNFFYRMKNRDRRLLGKMPKIDEHIYARENGWMIRALCEAYDWTGKAEYLKAATAAAYWILKNRSMEGGGFRHDAGADYYLSDSLAMSQAFFALYTSTADRKWLERAEETANFIDKNFKDSEAGFFSARVTADASGVFMKPLFKTDENTAMVRLCVRLFNATGRTPHRIRAAHAMRYLASPDLAGKRRFLTGLLLADQELAEDPLHASVVGPKSDLKAQALYRTALKSPEFFKRIEWWDSMEGPLPNSDVQYPQLEMPALFICKNKTCSRPIYDPEQVVKLLTKKT